MGISEFEVPQTLKATNSMKMFSLKTIGFVLLGLAALGAVPAAHAVFAPISVGQTVTPVPQDTLAFVAGTPVDSILSNWSDGLNSGSVFEQVYASPTVTDFVYFLNLNPAVANPLAFVAGLNVYGFEDLNTSVAYGVFTLSGASAPSAAERFSDGSIAFEFEGVPGIDQGEYGGNLFSQLLAVQVSGSFNSFEPVTSLVQGGNGVATVQTLAVVPDSGKTLMLLALAAGGIIVYWRVQTLRCES